jgi:hypothetical protein
MLARLAAFIQTQFIRKSRRIVAALEGERGQGTVEYVGLILLVSLLMVGMVAAMKGFKSIQSTPRPACGGRMASSAFIHFHFRGHARLSHKGPGDNHPLTRLR